jgi:hypothetical protein
VKKVAYDQSEDLRNPFFDDGFAAIEAGADFLGFNFYSQSKRYIDPEVCKRVTHLLKAQSPTIQFVGIFVNSETDYIKEVKNYMTTTLLPPNSGHTADSSCRKR